MKNLILAVPLLAALALVGCTAPSPAAETTADQIAVGTSAEGAPSGEAAESVSKSGSSASLNVWADQKMEQWFNAEGSSKGVQGFIGDFRLIKSWEASKSGEIVLRVDGSITTHDDVYNQKLGSANNLWLIPAVMMESIYEIAPELEKVTAITDDGKRTEAFTRNDLFPVPSAEDSACGEKDLECWADEKYNQWLASMDETYRGMCGKISRLADYHQCIPSDPHGFVDSVEAPEPGELLVTLADGVWQDNTYDTEEIPGIDFVSSNMAVRIAEKDVGLKQVTVMTADGDKTSTNQPHPDRYAFYAG